MIDDYGLVLDCRDEGFDGQLGLLSAFTQHLPGTFSTLAAFCSDTEPFTQVFDGAGTVPHDFLAYMLVGDLFTNTNVHSAH